MFVLSFVNFNPRVLSRKLRTRAQASHGNITVLSLLKIRAHLWYGTIFLFLEQIAPPWRHKSARIHAHVGGCRVDVVTLPGQNGEFGENLLKIVHSDGRE